LKDGRVTRVCFVWFIMLRVLFPARAQDPAHSPEPATESRSGSDLYKNYCAACHGVSGKGDGQLAEDLRYRPADLTLIAKHNKGVFDGDKVRRMIDGRDPVKGHAGPEMPVWGDAFKRANERYDDKAVALRIQAIVDYLKSLQVKEAAPPDARPK
jgi:mono/diheme cytochrome c family protein